MKYKVGDKVRIREDLVMGGNYGGSVAVEEMSAAEAIKAFTEICGEHMCYKCPVGKIDKDLNCREIKIQKPEKVIEVLKQWKSDHEKKPIETEFAKIIRVIEDTGSGKVCVHEEEIDVIPGKLNEKMEEVLKNWCKDHDGKFFTVLERICRVKE